MSQYEFESVARFLQDSNPFDGNLMGAAVEELHGLIDRVAPGAAWNPRCCVEAALTLWKNRRSLGDDEIAMLPQRTADLVRAAGALLAVGSTLPHSTPAPLPAKPVRPEPTRLTLSEPDEDGDDESKLRLSESRLRMISELALGEIMVELGMIDTEQLLTALQAQRATSLRFGEALVDLGLATWPDIQKAMAIQDENRGRRAS